MPSHLLFFPYLPLGERVTMNGWTLVPSSEVDLNECADEHALKCVAGLVGLYSFKRSQAPVGAFVKPPRRCIGDPFDAAHMAALRRSVLIALLDRNPSPLTPEDEQTGNEAGGTYTSGHALQLWGHRIDEQGWVAEERGGMVCQGCLGKELSVSGGDDTFIRKAKAAMELLLSA